MGSVDTSLWRWLESRSSTVFLVAGVWFVGYSGIKTTRLITDIAVPDVLSVAVGNLGLLVLVFCLLSVYPRVKGAAPRLSRAGIGTALLSGVCSTILFVALINITLTVEGYPAIPEDTTQGLLPPVVGVALLFASLLTLLLGFLLIGVASLRTDIVSRATGALLLVPAVMWTALFVMHATGVDGTVIGIVVYVPIAAALLTLGYRFRGISVPVDWEQRETEPTV